MGIPCGKYRLQTAVRGHAAEPFNGVFLGAYRYDRGLRIPVKANSAKDVPRFGKRTRRLEQHHHVIGSSKRIESVRTTSIVLASSVARTAGRRKGTSAPHTRAASAMAGESVEQTTRHPGPRTEGRLTSNPSGAPHERDPRQSREVLPREPFGPQAGIRKRTASSIDNRREPSGEQDSPVSDGLPALHEEDR
jgi:hypothetical protein